MSIHWIEAGIQIEAGPAYNFIPYSFRDRDKIEVPSGGHISGSGGPTESCKKRKCVKSSKEERQTGHDAVTSMHDAKNGSGARIDDYGR